MGGSTPEGSIISFLRPEGASSEPWAEKEKEGTMSKQLAWRPHETQTATLAKFDMQVRDLLLRRDRCPVAGPVVRSRMNEFTRSSGNHRGHG